MPNTRNSPSHGCYRSVALGQAPDFSLFEFFVRHQHLIVGKKMKT